eukprot:403333677
MNLLQLEQRSFDKGNNSTVGGENFSKINNFQGLHPILPERQLKIQSKTWHRDSHGLFDFESISSLKKQSINARGTVIISRDQIDELHVEPPKAGIVNNQREDGIASCIYSQGQYFLYHAQEMDLTFKQLQSNVIKDEMTQILKDLSKKVYLVVKHLKIKKPQKPKMGNQKLPSEDIKGTVLRVGDIIKFGRVPFRIKETSLQKYGMNQHDSHQNYENSLEKNITDVDSIDDRDYESYQKKTTKKESTFKRLQDQPIFQNDLHHDSDDGFQNMYGLSPHMYNEYMQDSIADDPNRVASFNLRDSQVVDRDNLSKLNKPDLDENQYFKSKQVKTLKAPILRSCRICLGEENESDNELITPCKCAGTMKYIHVLCLQEWLNGKKTVRELPFSTIYLYKISQCELCKSSFPDNVKTKKKKIEIFKLNRPQEGHYLIMEVLGMPNGRTVEVMNLMCFCILPKSSIDNPLKVGLANDFEYFLCSDNLPKELLKQLKILLGDSYSNMKTQASPKNSKQNSKREDEEINNYLSELSQGQNQNTILTRKLNQNANKIKLNKVSPMFLVNPNQNLLTQEGPGPNQNHNNLTIPRLHSPTHRQSVINNEFSSQSQLVQHNRVLSLSSRPQSNQTNTFHQISPRNLIIGASGSQQLKHPEFKIRMNETLNSNQHSQFREMLPKSGSHFKEEIKEEEEEKLMDEICQEQDDKDKTLRLQQVIEESQKLINDQDALGQSQKQSLIIQTQQRDNMSAQDFQATSRAQSNSRSNNRQNQGTVMAIQDQEQEQIGF